MDSRKNRETLLSVCDAFSFQTDLPVLFSREAPFEMSIHGIPRLGILLDGSMVFQIFRNGKPDLATLAAPALYYCGANGAQTCSYKTTSVSISFCFYPKYVRIVYVVCDGIHRPPHGGNAYFHTGTPLSEGGFHLLSAIESFQREGKMPLVMRLLDEIYRMSVDILRNDTNGATLRVSRKWTDLQFYLRAHRTKSITRTELAHLFDLSPGSISRLVRCNAGCTLVELRNRYRMEFAAELLRKTNLTVEDISEQCGFRYSCYFYRCFHHFCGMTPHEYRERPEAVSPEK